eukprot:jgi/Tetstr1/430834/TSEL_020616.t1
MYRGGRSGGRAATRRSARSNASMNGGISREAVPERKQMRMRLSEKEREGTMHYCYASRKRRLRGPDLPCAIRLDKWYQRFETAEFPGLRDSTLSATFSKDYRKWRRKHVLREDRKFTKGDPKLATSLQQVLKGLGNALTTVEKGILKDVLQQLKPADEAGRGGGPARQEIPARNGGPAKPASRDKPGGATDPVPQLETSHLRDKFTALYQAKSKGVGFYMKCDRRVVRLGTLDFCPGQVTWNCAGEEHGVNAAGAEDPGVPAAPQPAPPAAPEPANSLDTNDRRAASTLRGMGRMPQQPEAGRGAKRMAPAFPEPAPTKLPRNDSTTQGGGGCADGSNQANYSTACPSRTVGTDPTNDANVCQSNWQQVHAVPQAAASRRAARQQTSFGHADGGVPPDGDAEEAPAQGAGEDGGNACPGGRPRAGVQGRAGLSNVGQSCYLNAAIAQYVQDGALPESQLQELRNELCRYSGNRMIPGRQEDANECLQYILQGFQDSQKCTACQARLCEWCELVMQQTTVCRLCGHHIAVKDEEMLHLHIPIGASLLQEALEKEMADEVLDGVKRVCDNCTRRRCAPVAVAPVGERDAARWSAEERGGLRCDVIRQQAILQPPRALFVHLQRFAHGGSLKVSEHMVFQETLSLTPFLSQSGEAEYELRAVVVHEGNNLDRGHYISFVKDGEQWWEVDDLRTAMVEARDVLKQQAYQLAYVRKVRPAPKGVPPDTPATPIAEDHASSGRLGGGRQSLCGDAAQAPGESRDGADQGSDIPGGGFADASVTLLGIGPASDERGGSPDPSDALHPAPAAAAQPAPSQQRPPACAVDSRPPQQSSMEEVPAEAPGQSPANDGPVGGGAVPDVPPQDCRDEEMEEHKGEAYCEGTPSAAGGGGPGGPGDTLSRWAGHQPAMPAPAHAHAHPTAAKEHGHAPRDVQGGHADVIPTLLIVTGLGEDYKGVESLKEWYMNHKSKPYQASRDLELWLLNVGQMVRTAVGIYHPIASCCGAQSRVPAHLY